MNERIKELANEAAKYSATMFLPTGENGDKLFIEKFAELIVRECVQLCESATDFNKQTKLMLTENSVVEKMIISGCIAQSEKLANGIKQHFGVEE